MTNSAGPQELPFGPTTIKGSISINSTARSVSVNSLYQERLLLSSRISTARDELESIVNKLTAISDEKEAVDVCFEENPNGIISLLQRNLHSDDKHIKGIERLIESLHILIG